MSNNTAQAVIQALVEGNDPTTGKPLPHDSVLNRADVLRALLSALSAMESLAAREARRAQLPDNVGKAWSKEEEKQLIHAFKDNTSIADLAILHSRTVRAIEARLERLGLMTEAQRTTGNSFFTLGKGKSNE
jgi:hypothetical protein